MKKKYFFIIAIVFSYLAGNSQHYSLQSQYMFNGLLINPGYAGSTNCLDLTVSHRRQWTGLSQSPVTSGIAFHSPVKSDKIAMGIVFTDDRIGVTTKQNLNAVYCYRLKLGESSVGLGIQAGLEFGRANWEKLIRNDAEDAVLQSLSGSSMDFTTGTGVYFQHKKINAGISLPYLLNTSTNKGFLSGPTLIYGGYNFFLADSSVIKSSLLFRTVKGSPAQVDLNAIFSWKQKYGVGVSYRHKESVIALLEFNLKKQFRLCYSYDFGIGDLKKYNNGSHEITLRYLISGAGEKMKEKNSGETKTGGE